MSWITAIQADEFLSPNEQWDAFTNKDTLLKLATNRLEQLTFKDEPIDRVGFRYVDGNSVSKVAGSSDFLLDSQEGNFAYHAELGWTRGQESNDLVIYTPTIQVVFDVPHESSGQYFYEKELTFKEIQSLQSFGGVFKGRIVLDETTGINGMFSSFETNQATGIVGEDGEQIFFGVSNRRLSAAFSFSNLTYVQTTSASYGVTNVIFNGVDTRDVINEQGETVEITVPEVLPGEIFDYEVRVINGLDATMFMYVKGVLVGNPILSSTGQRKSRLQYSSGSSSGGNRHTYIRQFGATINTENPITIPVRLVGACALLAYEYGKFPPNFVGDKEYLENENDYNRMQDLPINVQAAVEPFLADYESVIIDGVATTAVRGKPIVEETIAKMTDIEYED
jgi:hypothetical protein